MKKTYSMDMCNGSILPKLLRFAIPLMCSSMLQLLFNAADIVIVGNCCGDESMAAVGSTTSLINLLTNLFIGLSVGSNVLTARYFGGKEDRKVHEVVHTAVAISIVSGLLLTVLGIILAEQILILMGTPKDILPLAVTYLRIYFLGMTAVMIYNFCNAILRAVGDTKRPLYYLFAAGVINVVLNLFFVVVCDLDVAGVAIATAISQCVSAILILRCLMKEQECYQLRLKDIRIRIPYLVRILRIGVPAGVYGTVFSLSNVVIQSAVNSFGTIVVAGNSAAMNIEGFVYVAMNAFHQAAISFTSQNMGAGKLDRVHKITLRSLLCVFVTGTTLGGLVVLFGRQLLGIYSNEPAVIEAGMTRLYMICILYAICGMMDVMVGVLRGLGYSIMPTVVSLIGACGLRLVWVYTIFQIPKFHTTPMLYLSYIITWTITFLAHFICYCIVRKHLQKRNTL